MYLPAFSTIEVNAALLRVKNSVQEDGETQFEWEFSVSQGNLNSVSGHVEWVL